MYAGTEGTLVGMGATIVPPLGQTQSFPLNAPSLPPLSLPFEGNIQYECDIPVHPFSLFPFPEKGWSPLLECGRLCRKTKVLYYKV